MAREERRSPLLEMFPTVDIMLDPDSELHADINCLLATLLPFGRSDALNRRGPLAYAFVISKSWKVSQIRPSRWKQAWRDESALKGRLDELVAANQIRALGTCERVELRRSTGLQDARELAIHILIEHRDRFSTDFLVPLEWAPVRKPWVSEPAAVDRVATGRPHRLWPGVEDLDREPAFAERAEEAFEDYSKYGIYEELHRAIDLASAALESLDAADPDYPDAADRLARFLAARFRHSGYTDDLEEATRLSRLAVDGDSSSPGRRARLGDTLGLRFISEGRIADLEDGMDEARGAYSSAVNSADRFECAEILADLLLTHYRATAERASLREVSTLVDSVAPVMEQERGTVSAELAASLATMCLFVYAANGIALNVEWAVKWSKWAIEATPKKAPSYARRLRDHGIALSRSYEITKDESQLAEAYACLDAALRRTHGDAPERRSIQLARAAARVHRLAPERLNGLRKAVDADRRTIEADEIAVDPHSPFSQNLTLMQAFQLEAERASFRLSDDEFASAGLEPVSQFLSLAVISVEDVFRSLPDNSPERPNVLALLATLYRDRFEGSGDLTLGVQ